MSCLADVSIHNAMKAVSQALGLDDGSRRHDAYVHYLQCVQYIVQVLLKDAQIPGTQYKINAIKSYWIFWL